MAKSIQFRVGDFVRRNRRVARIQRIRGKRVHLRILRDLAFRIYDSEVVDLDEAPVLLRKVEAGHYSSLLFESPERIEDLCKNDAETLMRLILAEHKTAFGKREFKQILVKDDGAVEEDRWNAFWNNAYRGMRAGEGFQVDGKGRYFLEDSSTEDG